MRGGGPRRRGRAYGVGARRCTTGYGRFHRDQFLEIVPAPGRLTVDLGCGEDRLSHDLKALGHTIVGIGSSPTNARRTDPSIEVHLADAARLPLADAFADLVIAFMSLEDIDDMPGAIGALSDPAPRLGRSPRRTPL